MNNAVDGILYQNGKIILIQRAGETFHKYFALPGGFVDENERVEDALHREMLEELGVSVEPIAILGVYSDKRRDPRGHVISTVFVCNYSGKPRAGDDAAAYQIMTLDQALGKQLAFDHKIILNDFKKWLKIKGTYWSKMVR
jgi:ADP-ribose pyrophosphatase YjhB (NUDIX family)